MRWVKKNLRNIAVFFYGRRRRSRASSIVTAAISDVHTVHGQISAGRLEIRRRRHTVTAAAAVVIAAVRWHRILVSIREIRGGHVYVMRVMRISSAAARRWRWRRRWPQSSVVLHRAGVLVVVRLLVLLRYPVHVHHHAAGVMVVVVDRRRRWWRRRVRRRRQVADGERRRL